jgi:uncharacterized protein YndB with AHSA1/START domain
MFFVQMADPSGNKLPATPGCYLDIVPNRRLVWTSALGSGGSGSSDRNLSGISGKICWVIEPCEAFVVKSSSLIFCYRSNPIAI